MLILISFCTCSALIVHTNSIIPTKIKLYHSNSQTNLVRKYHLYHFIWNDDPFKVSICLVAMDRSSIEKIIKFIYLLEQKYCEVCIHFEIDRSKFDLMAGYCLMGG